jgi:Holliday junction DNA helicase RuvA
MIGRLTGNIIEARPDEVLLDVAGVGYRLHVPLSTYFHVAAPVSGPISLHVHTHVREDAIQLFGFSTVQERSAFESLLSVSGIGPRIALAVLSGIEIGELERAVTGGEHGVLERIPGIGRRTAERVIVELRDRWPRPERSRPRRGLRVASAAAEAGPGSQVEAEAVSALLHLGYTESVASDAVDRVRRAASTDLPLEGVLRAALRALAR